MSLAGLFPPGFEKTLQDTMGNLYIGVVIGSIFFGITTLQTFFYYLTYPNDGLHIKTLVGLLWVFDAMSLAFYAHGCYSYLVLDFVDPVQLAFSVWTVASEPVISALIALIVHLFLCYRIYQLNRNWKIYATCLGLFSFFPYSLALTAVGREFSGPSRLWTVISGELHWLTIVANVVTSAQDLVIAGTIVWQLYTNKTGWGKTERMINLLIIYTVNTGMFPTFIALGDMIAYLVAPNTLIVEIFNISISKAYANTFLATLNSRQSIRGAGFDQSATGPTLDSMKFATPRTGTHATTKATEHSLSGSAYELRNFGSLNNTVNTLVTGNGSSQIGAKGDKVTLHSDGEV